MKAEDLCIYSNKGNSSLVIIIDVDSDSEATLPYYIFDGLYYSWVKKCSLELYDSVKTETNETKVIDWEQRRYEIARDIYARINDISCIDSVNRADNLIKALKGETE